MTLRGYRAAARAAGILAIGVLASGLTPAAMSAVADAKPAESGYCESTNPRCEDITVYSPSMQRDIAVQVLVPRDQSTPAPVLYLLNGVGGGEAAATWTHDTDVSDFTEDKHVYVVTPREGAYSYYTDWQRPDPGLAALEENNGANEWATFLTEELPPAIQHRYNTDGRRVLAGLSMSATSALNLAIRTRDTGPDGESFYDAVGAYSGCAKTSGPVASSAITGILAIGGADARNMWGPFGGPGWVAHDPYIHADRLPDVPIIVSTGNGLPGEHDTLDSPGIHGDAGLLANRLVVGGGLEALTNACTRLLKHRTDALGIDNIRYDLRPSGTHAWPYWGDELRASWPVYAKALGLRE